MARYFISYEMPLEDVHRTEIDALMRVEGIISVTVAQMISPTRDSDRRVMLIETAEMGGQVPLTMLKLLLMERYPGRQAVTMEIGYSIPPRRGRKGRRETLPTIGTMAGLGILGIPAELLPLSDSGLSTSAPVSAWHSGSSDPRRALFYIPPLRW